MSPGNTPTSPSLLSSEGKHAVCSLCYRLHLSDETMRSVWSKCCFCFSLWCPPVLSFFKKSSELLFPLRLNHLFTVSPPPRHQNSHTNVLLPYWLNPSCQVKITCCLTLFALSLHFNKKKKKKRKTSESKTHKHFHLSRRPPSDSNVSSVPPEQWCKNCRSVETTRNIDIVTFYISCFLMCDSFFNGL